MGDSRYPCRRPRATGIAGSAPLHISSFRFQLRAAIRKHPYTPPAIYLCDTMTLSQAFFGGWLTVTNNYWSCDCFLSGRRSERDNMRIEDSAKRTASQLTICREQRRLLDMFGEAVQEMLLLHNNSSWPSWLVIWNPIVSIY